MPEGSAKEPLSGASEGDDLALDGVEGLCTGRPSANAALQVTTSWLDRYLHLVVHFDRPESLRWSQPTEHCFRDCGDSSAGATELSASANP
jgi:hypothetical protein